MILILFIIDGLVEITESCPDTTRSNYIISTNYPNRYPSKQDCSWKIKAEDGKYFKLNIISFNLGTECYDYVDIFNVSNGRNEKIGRYCANNIPSKQILIFGNIIEIKFHSSNVNNHLGFKIGYASVQPGYFIIIHIMSVTINLITFWMKT